MEPAVIAVIGTASGAVGGATIAGLASSYVVRITTRAQNRSTGRQMAHEARNKRRDERREAFVAFLSAYHEFADKLLTHTEEKLAESQASFNRSYEMVQLTSQSTETRSYATELAKILWNLADDKDDAREKGSIPEGARKNIEKLSGIL